MARPDREHRSGRSVAVLGVLATVVALLVGCTSDRNDSVPPLSVAPGPPGRTPVAVAPTPGGAAFSACDNGFECATIPVPLDYTNPTGPTIPVAIVRQAAKDQANKIGVLLVNPGGPGGSGIDLVESGTIPPEVADRFDVIGFDPRGVGRSQGLQCPIGPDSPYFGDPEPGNAANEAATTTAVDQYDAACAAKYPALLPHLGTRDVANDMDRIREALGQQQISYLGFSYGTAIGQVYAEMFPQRIRAMVLDGVVDLSKPGMDSSQAISFENSLHQFANACSADPSCPIRADPMGTVDRVAARVAASPMPVPGARPLSAGLFEIGLSMPLYSKDSWPSLAKALAAADTGDGSGMSRLANAYFQGSNSDAYNAVTCLDNAWPRDDAAVVASSRATAALAPHFSGNVMISGLTCADWPAPQQVLTPLTTYTGPQILVLGTTNDPATPYQNSVDLVRGLGGSAVLLTHQGDGHTVYTNGNDCIDDQVDRYLLENAPPSTPTCGP